jgi:hypothetical protein
MDILARYYRYYQFTDYRLQSLHNIYDVRKVSSIDQAVIDLVEGVPIWGVPGLEVDSFAHDVTTIARKGLWDQFIPAWIVAIAILYFLSSLIGLRRPTVIVHSKWPIVSPFSVCCWSSSC